LIGLYGFYFPFYVSFLRVYLVYDFDTNNNKTYWSGCPSCQSEHSKQTHFVFKWKVVIWKWCSRC